MWSSDYSLYVMVAVYAVLAIGIAALLVVYRRRRARHRPGNVQVPTTAPGAGRTKIVNVRYELISPPYKQGGIATVWRAIDRKTGETCIIKTPRRGTQMDNVYLNKLLLEGTYLRRLRHPGIVRYIDDFYYEGEFHLVIEYLDGETLMALSLRSPFTENQVVVWACQLLDALSCIHSAGIVHRDINPKNVMLCSNGTVKLIDFDTATSIRDGARTEVRRDDPFTQITNKGFDIPELLSGGKVDQRCDLCGLAQTCIYLLTLEHPNQVCLDLFKSSWPRSYSEAKSVADYLVSAGVSKRMARCLAQGTLFSPDHRFADARAMKAALLSASGYTEKLVETLSTK